MWAFHAQQAQPQQLMQCDVRPVDGCVELFGDGWRCGLRERTHCGHDI